MNPPTDDVLAHRLGDVARMLNRQSTVEDTLQVIVRSAVDTVEGAERAGVMVMSKDKRLDVPALTDDVVRRIDELQIELDEGPCLAAVRHQSTVLLHDTAAEERWRRFGPAAAELGVRSMLSFRLFSDDRRLGSLTLLAGQPDVFDDRSVVVGELFATHAAIALHGVNRKSGLEAALETRDVIGQAKGILMHRDRITDDEAFQALVEASQSANMKLVDVAHWLVRSTTADPSPAASDPV